mgnify:CR=1 FL=1
MRGIQSVFRLSVIVAAGLPLAAVASETAGPPAAPVTVDDLFRYGLAEPNSVLDPLLEPQELNGCEIAHLTAPHC